MDISGMRSRRIAYGEQALPERTGLRKSGADDAGVRTLHLGTGMDAGVAAASAARVSRGRVEQRDAASAQVSKALNSAETPSMQGRQEVRGRQRGAGVHLDAGSRTRLRNELLLSRIAEHFSKTDPATGTRSLQLPLFHTLWKERASDPTGYEMVAEYASRNQSDTDVAFLRAVDVLKKDPSIDGARRLLQTFIEPLPVDDFGMEIPVPGRSVLNMVNDSARKSLLKAGEEAIKKAMDSGQPADLQALASLFDTTASQAASLVAKNLNTLSSDLRRHNATATTSAQA